MNIEETKPIDVLATRVWSGTHWHYAQLEQMIGELRTLRAECERLAKERDHWKGTAERLNAKEADTWKKCSH